ncbi:putative [Myosin heavy-chain] kinase transcription factor WD40-like family [Helianthus annuus]|nr:putative [Myosin heavy-chain] kinase transcription factor WD40-like family [Helianthus annuus]
MKHRPLLSILSSTTTTTTQPPTTTVKFLAVHNHRLYLTTTDTLIHVIHTSSFNLLDAFTVSVPVKSIAFSNGNIYTAHHDNKIRVWKIIKDKQHKHITTLPTLEDKLLRSVSPKNYVNVRRHKRKLWIQHYDAVSALAFITDELFCSVSWDKCLKIWRTSDFRCVQSIQAHDDAINDVVVSTNGTIFTGSADCKIKMWGKVYGKYELIATLDNKHKSGVNALVLNDDGLLLFSGGSDGAVLVWGKEHGSNGRVLTEVLRGHCKAVLCLISVCDLLLSGSADRTVRIWRGGCEGKLGGFYCLKVLDGYERPVRSLVADYDCKSGIRVFSEGPNGVIRLITIKGLNISDSMSILV